LHLLFAEEGFFCLEAQFSPDPLQPQVQVFLYRRYEMKPEDFSTRPINPKLRDAIFQAGLTQIRLAEISNVPRQYISQHINGRFILTDTQKKRIADALNRTLDELFQ
jgi:hypothetical protein